jgi:hypothetical protein
MNENLSIENSFSWIRERWQGSRCFLCQIPEKSLGNKGDYIWKSKRGEKH